MLTTARLHLNNQSRLRAGRRLILLNLLTVLAPEHSLAMVCQAAPGRWYQREGFRRRQHPPFDCQTAVL